MYFVCILSRILMFWFLLKCEFGYRLFQFQHYSVICCSLYMIHRPWYSNARGERNVFDVFLLSCFCAVCWYKHILFRRKGLGAAYTCNVTMPSPEERTKEHHPSPNHIHTHICTTYSSAGYLTVPNLLLLCSMTLLLAWLAEVLLPYQGLCSVFG